MKNEALLNADNKILHGDVDFNMLHCFYPIINNIPILIRDLICQEFKWSIPTFYEKIGFNQKKQMRLSITEKKTILEIIYYVLTSQTLQVKAIQEKCFF